VPARGLSGAAVFVRPQQAAAGWMQIDLIGQKFGATWLYCLDFSAR
jgi:hypothetical protein